MKNPEIKALHIITLFSIGGATETVISIVEGLQNKGYTVHIATGPNIPSEGSMYKEAQEKNIEVFTFKNLRREINIFRDVLAILALYRFIKKGNYDIVHTHSSKAGVIGRLSAKLAGVKVIIHTLHGIPFHNYQSGITRRTFIYLEKLFSKITSKLVSVTYTIIDLMVKEKITSRNKFVMIRSSFDLEPFEKINQEGRKHIRKKYDFSEKDIVIGKVGRLSLLKGHHFLLSAMKDVVKINSHIKLLIIGNGELESKLKEFVRENNLEKNVFFTGLILPNQIPVYLNSLDILVHTSLVEGLARVIPQALMLEKPVISFDLDGSHEIIRNDINGYLIEPQNIENLKNKIIEICLDKQKIKEMGKKGREILGDSFSEKKMVDEIDILYKSLLNDE